MDIEVRVKMIQGQCPVYQVGDAFRLQCGYQLVSSKPVCMHALSALMPFCNALRFAEPAQVGIAGREDKSKGYVQCPDAFACTGGGTAIFELSRAAS